MDSINYNLIFNKEIEKVKNLNKKPKLLMHSCCAPCTTSCLTRIVDFFETDLFFYNPNITSELEYNKRLLELQKFINLAYNDSIKILFEDYNSQEFLSYVKGYEQEKEGGKRCKLCYELRLEKTAELAKKLNYDYFTTTLTVSPYKNANWINEIGLNLENKYGVKFLLSDFKKENGYKNSINLSKEYGLYRQNYCGCLFSIEEKVNLKK